MKLVENWKSCWKWLSVHVATVTMLIGAAQANLPSVQSFVPPQTFGWLTFGLGMATVAARLIGQDKSAP